MAFAHLDFHSEALQISTTINVVLPHAIPYTQAPAKPRRHPVLWLLHGLSDDHTLWMRQTAVERYATARGLAVVMPAVNRSYYQNMAHGAPYRDFYQKELPYIARATFPLSDAREDNFVAGLSMGGYGALLWALSEPQRFAAAAALSGALDIAASIPKFAKESPAKKAEYLNIFGDLRKIKGGPSDLFALAAGHMKAKTRLPKLFAACGTEDFLLDYNRNFRDHAKKLGLPLDYHEAPGTHDWTFWDHWIEQVIAWLPVRAK